ncbi:MAG: hypothetical protein U0800_19915 [Isosphaeraceae bacterium]
MHASTTNATGPLSNPPASGPRRPGGAVQLRIQRAGGPARHQIFDSVRSAVRSAEGLAGSGFEVQLLSTAGRVLLHYGARRHDPGA